MILVNSQPDVSVEPALMIPLRAYPHLRRLLAGRLLREIGWLRLALLVPVLLVAVAQGLVLAAAHPRGQWAVPGLVVLLLGTAHRQRADIRFLATSAPAYRRWLAVEYSLWALPAAAALAAFGDWGVVLLTVVLASAVAALPPARQSRSTRQRARSLFRSEAFEWVSGLRQGGLWAWPLLLAGAGWQLSTPLGPVLALAGWLLVLLGNYGTPEPVTMLVLAARTPGQFLGRRLVLGLGYAALMAAPLLWLLGSGPAGPGAAVAVGLAWLGMLGLLILAKYALYPNATHIRVTQALVVGVALTMMGHPSYPALLLAAVGGLLWQSQRRLRRVLGQ